MFEQFAPDAKAVVTAAVEEAQLRGNRRIGTEHLLLGVLREPSSPAVHALGVDLAAARSALTALDESALAAIGIDVRGMERSTVPPAPKRTPLTSGARAVFPRALSEVRRRGSRRVTSQDLLLALLGCEPPDPAADLMTQLGIDRAAVRDALRQPAA